MDLNNKHNRIFRTSPRDLTMQRKKQTFQKHHSLFLRIKKNSSVLAKPNTSLNMSYDEQNNQNMQNSIHFFQQDNQVTQSQVGSVLGHNANNIGQFSLKLSKRKSLNQILPQLPNTSSSQVKKKQKSALINEQQIVGTMLGSLSSRDILQKYKKKRLQQQLKSKRYLQDHIKNLKLVEAYDSEEESRKISQNIPIYKEQKSFNLITTAATTNTSRSMSISLSQSKQMNKIRVSQQKLLKLLNNQLSDKDYSEYNKKLFEKKDVSKRRFFKRYHNILKRQRQQAEANESKETRKSKSKDNP